MYTQDVMRAIFNKFSIYHLSKYAVEQEIQESQLFFRGGVSSLGVVSRYFPILVLERAGPSHHHISSRYTREAVLGTTVARCKLERESVPEQGL